MKGLRKCITKNIALRYPAAEDRDDYFDQQVLNFYTRQVWRIRRREANLEQPNELSAESDDNGSSENDNERMPSLPCSPS